MKRVRLLAKPALLGAILIGFSPISIIGAQEPISVASIEVTPASLTLDVGEKITLTATALDEAGNPIDAAIVFFSRSRRNVGVTNEGEVEAYRPGESRTPGAGAPRTGSCPLSGLGHVNVTAHATMHHVVSRI